MKIIILITIITLALTAGSKAYESGLSDHGISVNKKFSPQCSLIFESVIKPWIEAEFKKDISDELLDIRRNLVYVEMYRYEIIDGKDHYSVHIEFAVKMKEISTSMEAATMRGQEIIFWIENKEVKDFFPFTEYILEEILI